jgi:hypothetical protein
VSTAGIMALVDRATTDMTAAEAAMFIEGLLDQLSERHREFDRAASNAMMNDWWEEKKGAGREDSTRPLGSNF